MLLLQTITTFDTALFNWCQGRRQKHVRVDRISSNISRLGDGFLYACIGVLLALFEPLDGTVFVWSCLFAFVIAFPLYYVLKNTIRRDRPYNKLPFDAVVRPSDKFGFPSGHAAAAFLFASVLSQSYPTAAVLSYSIAVLIGVSRIFLGVHYPADIVAGAAVGVICADISFRVIGL